MAAQPPSFQLLLPYDCCPGLILLLHQQCQIRDCSDRLSDVRINITPSRAFQTITLNNIAGIPQHFGFIGAYMHFFNAFKQSSFVLLSFNSENFAIDLHYIEKNTAATDSAIIGISFILIFFSSIKSYRLQAIIIYFDTCKSIAERLQPLHGTKIYNRLLI